MNNSCEVLKNNNKNKVPCTSPVETNYKLELRLRNDQSKNSQSMLTVLPFLLLTVFHTVFSKVSRGIVRGFI